MVLAWCSPRVRGKLEVSVCFFFLRDVRWGPFRIGGKIVDASGMSAENTMHLWLVMRRITISGVLR